MLIKGNGGRDDDDDAAAADDDDDDDESCHQFSWFHQLSQFHEWFMETCMIRLLPCHTFIQTGNSSRIKFTEDACLKTWQAKGIAGCSPPNLVRNLEMVESYHAKASDESALCICWPCGVFGHVTTIHAPTRGLNSNSARYSTRFFWWKYYVTNTKQPEETNKNLENLYNLLKKCFHLNQETPAPKKTRETPQILNRSLLHLI